MVSYVIQCCSYFTSLNVSHSLHLACKESRPDALIWIQMNGWNVASIPWYGLKCTIGNGINERTSFWTFCLLHSENKGHHHPWMFCMDFDGDS